MQNLEPLLVFIRVAETGSFTRAADSLGIQKGRASTAVRRLEEDVGVRLLHRTTRSVQLTEDGRAFHARARPVGRGRRPAFDVRGRSRSTAWAPSGRSANRTGPHDHRAGLAGLHGRPSQMGVGGLEHRPAGRSNTGIRRHLESGALVEFSRISAPTRSTCPS
ncbi:LysR family transcriptional regulator [Lichenicoccus sp.]|uniref:LysR family transcriptional regulator n=1 Tax=Lichenicoccus sp. TaxID=2781899 RepID=UPI003D0C2701